MNTPNWDKAFTHAIEIRQFRTEQGRIHYQTLIDTLLEKGGSFAILAGRLYLSQFSMDIFTEIVTNERNTMGDLSKAEDLANRLASVKLEADVFFQPFISDWLSIMRKTKTWLTEEDSCQPFHFVEINDVGITFASDDWDEYAGLGGYDTHPGQEITIPFDFFDDPTPFRDHANQVADERDKNAQKSEKRAAQAMVKRLQSELKEAQKKAEAIK